MVVAFKSLTQEFLNPSGHVNVPKSNTGISGHLYLSGMRIRGRYKNYPSKARLPYVLMKEDGFNTNYIMGCTTTCWQSNWHNVMQSDMKFTSICVKLALIELKFYWTVFLHLTECNYCSSYAWCAYGLLSVYRHMLFQYTTLQKTTSSTATKCICVSVLFLPTRIFFPENY